MSPQLLAHQRQCVSEGRIALTVPGSSSYCLRALGHVLMSEQRDHREQSQQRRSGPLDRSLGPMPLRLQSQALAYFLEGRLHLPASDEPGNDPLRLGTKIGAEERLGPELCSGVSDEHPTQRHGGQARAVPNSGIGDHLYRTLPFAVPVAHRDGPPDGGRVFGNDREVRQPLTFEARSSHLAGVAWWSRFVKSGIQAQAGNQGDRVSQALAAVEQLERGVGAIGDGDYLALWVPASHQKKQLPGPIGQLLVPLALLFGVTLRVGQR